jgi:hypothetical protein
VAKPQSGNLQVDDISEGSSKGPDSAGVTVTLRKTEFLQIESSDRERMNEFLTKMRIKPDDWLTAMAHVAQLNGRFQNRPPVTDAPIRLLEFRTPTYEPEGREFESARAHSFFPLLALENKRAAHGKSN